MSSRRFSFTRFMGNAFPAVSRSNANDIDLTQAEADNLYQWQMLQENPRLLNEQSFRLAGVLDEKSAKKAIATLLGLGILDPEYGVDTTRINRHFASAMTPLSMGRQRRIVGLLFHWEEELRRLRALDAQETELRHLLGQTSDSGTIHSITVLLQSVEMKRQLLPSVRTRPSEQLPMYSPGDTDNRSAVSPAAARADAVA